MFHWPWSSQRVIPYNNQWWNNVPEQLRRPGHYSAVTVVSCCWIAFVVIKIIRFLGLVVFPCFYCCYLCFCCFLCICCCFLLCCSLLFCRFFLFLLSFLVVIVAVPLYLLLVVLLWLSLPSCCLLFCCSVVGCTLFTVGLVRKSTTQIPAPSNQPCNHSITLLGVRVTTADLKTPRAHEELPEMYFGSQMLDIPSWKRTVCHNTPQWSLLSNINIAMGTH